MSTQIAWATGIFEGEGYMGKRNTGNSARLTMRMCDFDVVERVYEIFGCGNLGLFHPESHKTHKPQLGWNVGKKADVIKCLSLMLPYFGYRRAYDALNILDDLELGIN
jgi:hypothetical protein